MYGSEGKRIEEHALVISDSGYGAVPATVNMAVRLLLQLQYNPEYVDIRNIYFTRETVEGIKLQI